MASKIEILEAIGAPEGTRTHTLKAREPKSRMSTNSITGAQECSQSFELHSRDIGYHTGVCPKSQ